MLTMSENTFVGYSGFSCVDQATGRTTGNFIKMSNQDIIGATDNIKTVMTTIGKATVKYVGIESW